MILKTKNKPLQALLIGALYLPVPLLAQTLYVPPNILIQDSFEAQLLRPELTLDSVAETSTTLTWQSVPAARYYQLFYATADFAMLSEATLDSLTNFARRVAPHRLPCITVG